MNRIVHIASTVATGADEPVTLQEFKDYAKHEWTGSDPWEVVEDALDTSFLLTAREIVEKHIRQNVVVRDLVVKMQVDQDDFPLPMGEVIGAVTLTDGDGNAIDSFEQFGNRIENLCAGKYIFSYQSGMSEVPETIKTAIKAQALFLYDNRLSTEMAPMAKAYLTGHICYDYY